jgi:hypothetical protein
MTNEKRPTIEETAKAFAALRDQRVADRKARSWPKVLPSLTLDFVEPLLLDEGDVVELRVNGREVFVRVARNIK